MITTYTYDRAGRLEWTLRGNQAKQNIYDSQGRLYEERAWYGDGPEDYRSTITLYDLLNRVIEERIENALGKVLHLARYAYDELGNKILEQLGEQVTRTDYNVFSEPVIITNALDEKTIIEYDRSFINQHGQNVLKKSIIDPLGTQTVEIYDTANRVVEITLYNPLGEMISRQERMLDLSGNPIRLIDFKMERVL